MRKAEIGVCVATVIDRTARPNSPATGSASQEISYAKAQGQLAYYRVLEAQGKVRMITDWPALEQHMQQWRANRNRAPLGFILGMEGADPIAWPEQVHSWWEDGLRVVGPRTMASAPTAHGTGTVGGLTDWGRVLLREMDDLGMILDLAHLAEPAFWEALELFQGRCWPATTTAAPWCPATASSPTTSSRPSSSATASSASACDAWMLYPGWIIGRPNPEVVGMEAVAEQIDHICQLAGSRGMWPWAATWTVAMAPSKRHATWTPSSTCRNWCHCSSARGYALADVEAIMHGNWLRFFQSAWS